MPHLLIAIERVFCWFLLYSFVGWLWETGLNIVMKKRFVDRGMLNGPLCPIYGFGAMIVLFALAGEHQPLVIFLSSGVLACTLEYVTSWGIEKLFHVRFWDYSNKPFNINGRVYLNGFVAFGLGATAVKLWVQPWVLGWLDRIPAVPLAVVSGILLAMLLADAAVTLAGLISLRSRLGHVETDIKDWKQEKIAEIDPVITRADEHLASARTSADEKLAAAESRADGHAAAVKADVARRLDSTRTGRHAEELAAKVRHEFSYQQRRLIENYPTLEDLSRPKLVAEVRRLLKKDKK
nr:putative ABC transporter permease [Bifidobacterium choloepi]